MKDSPQPNKRRRDDAAFRGEALRLASEIRSIQAHRPRPEYRPQTNLQVVKRSAYPRGNCPWGRTGPRHGGRVAPVAGCQPAAGAGVGNCKKSHCHLLADRHAMSRYRFIEAQCAHYSVRLLCQVLDVPASGYYAWHQVNQQQVNEEPSAWEEALVKVFGRHHQRYGTRRLQVALRRKGYRVGRQRLRAAMRRRGLHALQPKAFAPRTTDSTHGLRCAPNRLLDQPKSAQANRFWVNDITHLHWPTATGPTCAPIRTWSASRH